MSAMGEEQINALKDIGPKQSALLAMDIGPKSVVHLSLPVKMDLGVTAVEELYLFAQLSCQCLVDLQS